MLFLICLVFLTGMLTITYKCRSWILNDWFDAVQLTCHSFLQKLIRKDGDYHTSRMMDGKDIQANQNMQPKKKHKKSGSSIKVKEKVEVRTISQLEFHCLYFNSGFIHIVFVSIYFQQLKWRMTAPWKSRRTSSVITAMGLSEVVTTLNDIYSHIQVTTDGFYIYYCTLAVLAVKYGKRGNE